jgi:EAL and modified HD-GYP domain-containing signal transduction protein
MEVYLARQPIFDGKYRVAGYELLYRDAAEQGGAEISDAERDKETCRLLSDAMTVFGLKDLTNSTPAYMCFSDNLILNDFVRLAKPDEIVIEVAEDVQVTDILLEKLRVLKRAGYQLALNAYTGDARCDRLLPLMNTVKVNFRATNSSKQRAILSTLIKQNQLTPLAQNVDTQEEFDRAARMGYKLFQGYFFTKPTMLREKRGSMVQSSYFRLLAELNRPDGVDFANCAEIVHSDATLTYQIMRLVQSMSYYRGNLVTAIQQALVLIGADEVRRWVLLAMARDNNQSNSEEAVRHAYLRGAFAKRLMQKCDIDDDIENAFLMGMFSMLDQILDMNMVEILDQIELAEPVALALLGAADNFYSRLLQYVIIYESGNRTLLLPNIGLKLSAREVSRLYMDSVMETNRIYNATTEGSS